jgi:cell division transport system permease protein
MRFLPSKKSAERGGARPSSGGAGRARSAVGSRPARSAKPSKHPKGSGTNKNSNKHKAGNHKTSSLGFRNLKYYLVQTFKSLWRNKIMSFTSVVTVAACMFMVIASFAVTSNFSRFLDDLENTAGMTVHIDDDLTQSQVDLLERSLMDLNNVAGVRFVTPEEALEELMIMLGDVDGLLMKGFEGEENPLRRTFVLELNNIRMQRETVERINTLFGVALIDAPAEFADTLITINSFLNVMGFIIIAILAVLAVVIITNTIKLTVNNRRNEIVIMKYVGATDWFIKWPFILEGIIIGLLGGAIPLAVAWSVYERIISSIGIALSTDFPFRTATEVFPIIGPVALLFGAAIGALGSVTSIRRHLDA